MEMQAKAMSKTSELLEAQAHIHNHIFNFMNSMSLKCAIQLNIPDIIHNHGSPMRLSDLVNALRINESKSNCVSRLMRILIHSGFFLKQKISKNQEDGNEDEGYVLTSASCLLLKNEPLSVTPFLLAMLDPVLTKPWDNLCKWFESDDHPTPFDMAHSRPFWDYLGLESRLGCNFNDGMASDARLIGGVLIKECRGVFEELKSVVDVGGGTGTLAAIIADAFPHLQCINFDLPQVVDGLKGSTNMRHVGGDMFEAVPSADVALLKWILHDWSHQECIRILKRCKDAIGGKDKGGKVIIIDIVLNEQQKESKETQYFFDMLMMVLITGKERDEKEWATLFKDAGFTRYKITPVFGLRSLIEVYP